MYYYRCLHSGPHIGGIGRQIPIFAAERIWKFCIKIIIQFISFIIAGLKLQSRSQDLQTDMIVAVQYETYRFVIRTDNTSGSFLLHQRLIQQAALPQGDAVQFFHLIQSPDLIPAAVLSLDISQFLHHPPYHVPGLIVLKPGGEFILFPVS